MSLPVKEEITYKDGTLAVPHWGITLRSIFGAAVKSHSISRNGRRVALTLDGVYIGEIQLLGQSLPNDQPSRFRKNPDRR